MELTLREYRDIDLASGTLLVSIPSEGFGNLLLTDHLLDRHRMDHAAALDGDALPPLAMVRNGRARFPLRVHADAASRVAVLRGEFNVPPLLVRPLVRAVLAWVRRKGIARVITLDAVHAEPVRAEPQDSGLGAEEPAEEPRLWYLAWREATRRVAAAAGLEEFGQGVLAGVPAVLVLEGRFMDVDVLSLLAEVRTPVEGARSALAFARALPAFVPTLDVDAAGLGRELDGVERAIREVQGEAERVLERLQRRPRGEGVSMYE